MNEQMGIAFCIGLVLSLTLWQHAGWLVFAGTMAFLAYGACHYWRNRKKYRWWSETVLDLLTTAACYAAFTIGAILLQLCLSIFLLGAAM